jgi:signal transduction histidine kinase
LLLVIVLFIAVFFVQTRKQKREVEIRNRTISEINDQLTNSEQALTLSNQAKDKLFALVAHDLRGPVTSLQGIGRMLDFYIKKGDPERLAMLVGQIDQSANSVNHLLDNLLKWALSQTQGVNYHPISFNLNNMANDCVHLFEEASRAKQLVISAHFTENVSVLADQNMISTVIRNLLSNAIKFSPNGGEINIAAELLKDHVIVTVSDQGKGIAQATIDQILGNKMVTSTNGTNGEKGTGLGLALTRDFVQLHGYDLIIHSQIDKGTAISFKLKKA